MSKLKIGVFTAPFAREYFSSSSVKNTVYQYPGQMLLSDGELAYTLDDYTVKLLEKSSEATDKITPYYFELRKLVTSGAERIAELSNEAPRYDKLEWMIELESYPIAWFDTLEEALLHYQSQPSKGVICESSPVTVQ